MTEYNFRVIPTPKPLTTEKKEQRRRVLEAVLARRKQNYQRYVAKLQMRLKRGKFSASFD